MEKAWPSILATTADAQAAAAKQCREPSGVLAAPPMRRRAAIHRWSPSLTSWWRQLALLLALGPVILAQEEVRRLAEDYSNLHGVVNATDLSMFRKVGLGECMAPASRPVRGRAKQDLTHLKCRQSCIANCIGYTYAPCERVCTIHGNPELLNTTSDAEGWATVNGGGRIEGHSSRCGSACYQRMAPCVESKVVSNSAAVMSKPMPYGGTSTETCPLPYIGMLKLRCGLFGAYIEAGRCRSPCAPGLIESGNFDVYYDQFLHGKWTAASCPSGATGVITLECNDGKARWVSGRCGYDCVLGSQVEGDSILSYPPLNHTASYDLDCPNGTSGNVTILCFDSIVSTISGTCSYNCDPGEMVLMVGDTYDTIGYGAFNHSDQNETDCGSDWRTMAFVNRSNDSATWIVAQNGIPLCEEMFSDSCLGKVNINTVYESFGAIESFEGYTWVPWKKNGGVVKSGYLLETPFNATPFEPAVGVAYAVYYANASGQSVTKIEAQNYQAIWDTDPLDDPAIVDPTTGIPLSRGCNLRLLDGSPTYPCVTMAGLGKCQALSDQRRYNLRLAEIAVCQWFFGKPCKMLDTVGCSIEIFAPMRFQKDLSLYLPKNVDGKKVFKPVKDSDGKTVPNKFQATSEFLFGSSLYVDYTYLKGIEYRTEKSSSKLVRPRQALIVWGETIEAVDLQDGWLRVEAPAKGMLVKLTADEAAYKLECQASGLSWPYLEDGVTLRTSKMDYTARIMEADLVNETVKITEKLASSSDWGGPGVDWVPIRALVGMENYGQEKHIAAGIAVAAHSMLCDQKTGDLPGTRCDLFRNKAVVAGGLHMEDRVVKMRPMPGHRVELLQNASYKLGFKETIFPEANKPPITQENALNQEWTPVDGLTKPVYCQGLNCLVQTLQNSANFTGKLTLQCNRGKVGIIGGHCYRHCLPGVIGPGVKAVHYRRFEHDTKMKVQCMKGFIGEYELSCWDGNATIVDGHCLMHCLPGAVTSNSIKMPHLGFNHSTSMNVTCPWPQSYGIVNVTCNDGAVSFKGACGANCQGGSYYSHGATVPYGFIAHNITKNITCPSPWVGSILMRCYDGSSRYMGGWCGRQCPAGAVNKNGAVVYYTLMNHTDIKHFACSSLFSTGLSFSGGVTVECYDGTSRSKGYCEADCPDGKLAKDGSQVFYGSMPHLGETMAICTPGTPNLPLYGVVKVQCQRGYAKVLEGTCGAPCPAGEFRGSQTRDEPVVHNDIAHKSSKMVICPPHLSGYVKLFCTNGVVSVVGNGTCGDRCPPVEVITYGAMLKTPLMEHKATLKAPCDHPFNGHVVLSCDSGALNATSQCQAQCLAGNTTLGYGAVIHYPAMMSGELYTTQCPPGFVDVPVVIQCRDGQGFVSSGGCFRHCAADWFFDPTLFEGVPIPHGQSWSVQHYEIYHGSYSLRTCPQYYDGVITLSCWGGKITMTDGVCTKNCRPKRIQIRPGVIVRNREMLSGQMAAQIPCPPSFDGNMRLKCVEGVVSLGYGGCNRTCSPGVVMTAPYGELGDAEVAAVACPDSGTLTLVCNDGKVTVIGGRCLIGCQPGTVIDNNGTRIEHGYIRNNETSSGACTGLAKGVVTLACNDSLVTQAPQPGEACYRFCKAQPVSTPDGSVVFPPNTEHGNQASERCPNALLGIVTLACYDTEFKVIDGVCGDTNCPESVVYSNGAVLPHFEINNGWKAGPSTCPNPYEGIATFECRNGTTHVDEVTTQLPVSPEDWEAVAIGNESSQDSRFILCGCCYPRGTPPPAAPVKGRDTGIYVAIAIAAAVLSVTLAAFSGWYFLPRKRMDRVWPEKIKPPDPRPLKERAFEQILDKFQLELQNNPQLVQAALERNFKLQALPAPEQMKAIENMKSNSSEAKKFFTRRSVQYLLACEDKRRVPSTPSGKVAQAPRLSDLIALTDGGDEFVTQDEDMSPIRPAWQEMSPITDGQEQVGVSDLRQLADYTPENASPDVPEAPDTPSRTAP